MGRGAWQKIRVLGRCCNHGRPSRPWFLGCLPLFPAEAVGGALPNSAEAARPRLPPPQPQPPEDSCPNMELGFPQPRPRPQPAEDWGLQEGGGTARLGGWQAGEGAGRPKCRPRSSPGPGSLPQFPPQMAKVN